jgi:peptidoglycan/xylan/chitin deacetylase (PgdA/CDA1 family)
VRRYADVHATFDDAFHSVTSVLPELRRLGIRTTVFVCTGLADRDGAPLLVPELTTSQAEDLAGLRTLTWDDLRALAADGTAVGSHTVTHAHLPRLGDDELARELRESKQRIEDELAQQCPLLAYPYGEHDARVRAAARAARYEQAFALRAPRGDPFAVPRVDLYRRDNLVRTVAKTVVKGLIPSGFSAE